MAEKNQRDLFARAVLATVSPEDMPLFADYASATTDSQAGSLGSDFGLVETGLALGPVTVWIAHRVFDKLLEWIGDVAKKTIEGFLEDRGKEQLKLWLMSPDKTVVAGVTPTGKAEILRFVNQLATASKLPPAQTAKIVSGITLRLFGT